MAVLRSTGHVGYPPSVATDSQLGFSAMAYQSAEVLYDRCQGGGRSPVRIAGTRTRAHQGSQEGDMLQRARFGYCPYCALPTHVTVPSRYQAGEHSARNSHGI